MTTHTAIHYVKQIEASSNPEIPSFNLSVTASGRIPHTITLFVEDATLAARLVIAINDTCRIRAQEKEQESRDAEEA